MAVKWFATPPLNYSFDSNKMGANEADFVVSVAGGYEEPKLNVLSLAKEWAKSDVNVEFLDGLEEVVRGDVERAAEEQAKRNNIALVKRGKYPTSMIKQMRTLARRQMLKTIQNLKVRSLIPLRCNNYVRFAHSRPTYSLRSAQPIKASILRHVVVALFYGGIYNNLEPTDLLERSSLCFFTCMFVVMGHQQVSERSWKPPFEQKQLGLCSVIRLFYVFTHVRFECASLRSAPAHRTFPWCSRRGCCSTGRGPRKFTATLATSSRAGLRSSR